MVRGVRVQLLHRRRGGHRDPGPQTVRGVRARRLQAAVVGDTSRLHLVRVEMLEEPVVLTVHLGAAKLARERSPKTG